MDYVIQTRFQGPGFVAVPNAVAQSGRLSPEALGVLVYLASLPQGFLVRVVNIRETFGLGKDKWQRIARELREIGAMDVEPIKGEGGRHIGKRVLVRWPELDAETESRETRPSDRKPEKPTVGKTAKQGRETRQTGPGNPAPYKDQKQTQAGARVKPAAPRQPRRLPPVGVGAAGGDLVSMVGSLDPFQRTCLREGRSVLVNGSLLKPESSEHRLLAQAALGSMQ